MNSMRELKIFMKQYLRGLYIPYIYIYVSI